MKKISLEKILDLNVFEDFKESYNPIEEYLDEFDSIENEEILLTLMHLQNKVKGTEFYLSEVLQTGARFYLVAEDEDYPEDRDVFFVYEGKWEKESAREIIDRSIERDQVHEILGFLMEDHFNESFWKNPSPLYHGTSNKTFNLKNGLIPYAGARGLNNRNVMGIFTSLNKEFAADYAYGDDSVIFEINTKKMKEDGFTPYVYQEPDVVTADSYSALSGIFKIDYIYEITDQGISEDTVIFQTGIPLKYLKTVD